MRSALRITVRASLGSVALLLGWLGASQLDASATETVAGSVTAIAAPVPVSLPLPLPLPLPEKAKPADPPAEDLLGSFKLTRYVMAEESSYARPREATLAATTDEVDVPGDGVALYDDRGCKKLATVGARYAEVLDIEGSGRLRDGRTVNVSNGCRCGHSPCYRVTDDSARWGMSATSKPLVPFRTVAVDPKVIPLGTVLYIPELDGLTMPGVAPWGGYVHDGCVVASDVGGHIVGQHLDFFIGRQAYKRELDLRRKMPHVTVFLGENHCGHGSSVARHGSSI